MAASAATGCGTSSRRSPASAPALPLPPTPSAAAPKPTRSLRDASLGPAYRQLVDAVGEQVVDRGVTVRQLFGQPDDHKLVSSLTLFAGVAADLGDGWAATVVKSNEILDRAAEQGLPRCATTQRFLADDAGS